MIPIDPNAPTWMLRYNVEVQREIDEKQKEIDDLRARIEALEAP
ncbi:MAG: hypothetical protein AAGA08_16890 [Pseudomonadota bacterium]